ncbi:hypothetical protein ASF70_07455 [Rhizobium sp. Leaf321]|nr:hypothetical protein ASF70_07455 [Rhizobium sp. Leaf321]
MIATPNDPFSFAGPTPTVAETVAMLRGRPATAITWALEHLPHQMVEFFTEYQDDADPYIWAVKVTAWVEYVNAPA